MEVYIVRHGETIWNEKRLLQGNEDIELNEKGRELARITGKALEDVHFDKIYSSPLIRAYETANLIKGGRNIEIIRDDRLRELSFGINEGKDSIKIREDVNNPFHNFFAHPELYAAPEGGETLEHICERAKEFVKEVLEPHINEWERVMIVAHGALNKALMCYLMNHGIDEYWAGGLQRNCGVIILNANDEGYYLIEESKTFYSK